MENCRSMQTVISMFIFFLVIVCFLCYDVNTCICQTQCQCQCQSEFFSVAKIAELLQSPHGRNILESHSTISGNDSRKRNVFRR